MMDGHYWGLHDHQHPNYLGQDHHSGEDGSLLLGAGLESVQPMPAGPNPSPVVVAPLGSYFSPDHDAIMWSMSATPSAPHQQQHSSRPVFRVTGLENLCVVGAGGGICDDGDDDVRQWVAQVERKYQLDDRDDPRQHHHYEDHDVDTVMMRSPGGCCHHGYQDQGHHHCYADGGGDGGGERREARKLLAAYQKVDREALHMKQQQQRQILRSPRVMNQRHPQQQHPATAPAVPPASSLGSRGPSSKRPPPSTGVTVQNADKPRWASSYKSHSKENCHHQPPQQLGDAANARSRRATTTTAKRTAPQRHHQHDAPPHNREQQLQQQLVVKAVSPCCRPSPSRLHYCRGTGGPEEEEEDHMQQPPQPPRCRSSRMAVMTPSGRRPVQWEEGGRYHWAAAASPQVLYAFNEEDEEEAEDEGGAMVMVPPQHCLPPLDYRHGQPQQQMQRRRGNNSVKAPGAFSHEDMVEKGAGGGRGDGLSCSEHEMLRLVLRLMRRHFRAWREAVRAEVAVKAETAYLHHLKTVLERVLVAWRVVMERAEARALLALQRHRCSLLRMVLLPWKAHRRRSRALCRKALALARLHVTIKCFTALKRHADEQRAGREQEAVAQHVKACRVQQEQATRHYHRWLASRTFLWWVMAVRVAREEGRLARLHQERKKRIEEFVDGLVNGGRGDCGGDGDDPEELRASSHMIMVEEEGGAERQHRQEQPSSRHHGGGGGRRMVKEVMDERAEERRARRDALRERYLSQERERLEAERKRKEEEEDREAERIRREKREERQRAAERERMLERYREQLRASHLHYQRACLLYRGLLPWRRLVQQSDINHARAMTFYQDTLMEKVMRGWFCWITEAKQERRRAHDRMVMAADGKCVQLLCRRVMRGMQKHHGRLLARQRAVRVRDSIMRVKRALKCWGESLEVHRVVNARMQDQADCMAVRVTKRHTLRRWKECMQQWREEREVADRKALAWARVRGWLDDGTSATATLQRDDDDDHHHQYQGQPWLVDEHCEGGGEGVGEVLSSFQQSRGWMEEEALGDDAKGSEIRSEEEKGKRGKEDQKGLLLPDATHEWLQIEGGTGGYSWL